MKKLSQFLKSNISGMLNAISFKFGMWNSGIGEQHKLSCFINTARSYEGAKIVFFLPVNILTVLHAGFLVARHITVCLDT